MFSVDEFLEEQERIERKHEAAIQAQRARDRRVRAHLTGKQFLQFMGWVLAIGFVLGWLLFRMADWAAQL